MSADSRNTREFVAIWNETVEDHLVSQLAQSLPALARELSLGDSAHAMAMARPLVRALRLSAVSGDAAAAVRYLAEAARAGGATPPEIQG
jgi:hypothetical protein